MCPRRRTVLTALGSVGLAGGGLTYWQRHRIRRRDELDDIETALDTAVPSIAEPVTVSTSHVEAAYERAREYLAETDALLGSEPSSNTQNRLDRAREGLEANVPETATDDSERLAALEAYRLAIARSATARGWHYDDGTETSEELEQRYETLESELDTFESRYRGDSLTKTVVQSGEADSYHSQAVSRHRRARRFLDDDDLASAVAWEIVELGRFQLFNAEWFLRDQDGPDWEQTLEARFARLAEWTDTRAENVRWEDDDGVRTQARYRWINTILGFGPDEHLTEGWPALAVREQASLAVVAATLSSFEEFPSERELEGLDETLVQDTEELVTAKQTAVTEIELRLDERGSDPLVRYLLAKARRQIERGDRTLDRLLSNVRSYSRSEWRAGRDRAWLSYQDAAAVAGAIPDVIQVLEE